MYRTSPVVLSCLIYEEHSNFRLTCFWSSKLSLPTVTLHNRQHVVSNLGNMPWAKTYWSHSRCQHEPMDSCTCIGMYSTAPCTLPHSCMDWGHTTACSPWLSLISGHSCMNRCPRSPHSQPAHGNNRSGPDELSWILGVPWKKIPTYKALN